MPDSQIPGVPVEDVAIELTLINLVGATFDATVLTSKVTGDASSRFSMTADGTMTWTDNVGGGAVSLNRDTSGTALVCGQEIWASYSIPGGVKYARFAHNTSDVVIDNHGGAGGILFAANGTTIWKFDSSGYLLAGTDNTRDIGASGANRPRSIYWGTQLLGPNGSAGAPPFSFSGTPTYGFYYVAGRVGTTIGGATILSTESTGVYVESGYSIGFLSSTITSSPDAIFVRDGVGIIAQKNSTNAQTFRVYGTTIGSKYAAVAHDGTNARFSTTSGSLDLYTTPAGAYVNVYIATVLQYQFNDSAIISASDNARDLGGSSNRWRYIYWGTQALGSNGSVGTPSWSFSGDPDTGAYVSAANTLDFSCGGSLCLEFSTSYYQFYRDSSTIYLGGSGGSVQTTLAYGAGNLWLINGTNAQTFRVYGNATGSKYISVRHDGTDSFVDNSSGSMTLGATSGSITFTQTGVGTLWQINTLRLQAQTDNSYDIGASGATRPRTIYAATSFIAGAGQTWSVVAQSGAEGSSFNFSGTLSASPSDFNAWTYAPTLAGAFTVTRFNYLDLNNIAGAATITDACVFRFNAAAGTHKAVDSGTTKTSPGTVSAWTKININGTVHYQPAYTSKTT